MHTADPAIRRARWPNWPGFVLLRHCPHHEPLEVPKAAAFVARVPHGDGGMRAEPADLVLKLEPLGAAGRGLAGARRVVLVVLAAPAGGAAVERAARAAKTTARRFERARRSTTKNTHELGLP